MGSYSTRRLTPALAVSLLFSSPAMATTAKVCAEAYEQAQVERKAGHIARAIQDFTQCAAQDCPGFIRKDCVEWLAEAERARPTLVFSVRRNGSDLLDVEVTCDGGILSGAVSGKAVAVDPGQHAFVFRTAGAAAVRKTIVVHEGERNRMIEIAMDGPGIPVASTLAVGPPGARPRDARAAATVGEAKISLGGATDAQAPEAAPSNLLPYGLAGIGMLGVSGFAAFGLWGYSQKRDLEQSCSPFCQSSDTDAVRTKYLVADGCLVLGMASLAAATYLFATKPRSPTRAAHQDASVTIAPAFTGRGGVVDFATTF